MSEFKCSGCEYNSSQKANVTKHINKMNKCGENLSIIILESSYIICDYCKKNFSSKPNLIRHLKSCKIKKHGVEQELAEEKEKNLKLKEELAVAKALNDKPFTINNNQ